ncbi:MAG: ATP-binding protein, partial [Syntrophales bacterium]
MNTIKGRITERRRFMQVIVGPRQTGKTTLARQLIDDLGLPSHYASADEPTLKTPTWIEQQWETARMKARASEHKKALLVLDEVQKIGNWSEVVKRLWDEDTALGGALQVIILGSSPLLIQTGLTESLAGRFELIPVVHWSFSEMKEAFGWNVEQYIFYGGYPGSADLISDPRRWANY